MNVFNVPCAPKKKTFRAKPIAEFEWSGYTTVRVEISVGRNYHEGARLVATLEWAKANFNQTIILLGDTLQRYNLMMDGLSAEDAYKQSLLDGNDWLERNAELLSGLKVLRWDDIIEHPDFINARSKVSKLYGQNLLVKQEINKAMDEVAERREIKPSQSEIFFRLSENYLLEEIAGAAIANTIYPGVSAYPGSLPGLWNVVNDIPYHSMPRGLSDAKSIELRLYKK
jgi:tRNA-dependent cyclodipeptide synthase